MKTRIVNGQKENNYSEQFLLDNPELVKDWELVDFEPTTEKPQSIIDWEKKQQRETLLNKGVIIIDEFWFNEYYLAQFISLIGVCERENKLIEWKSINDIWVSLSVKTANSIAYEASLQFQEIYKTT